MEQVNTLYDNITAMLLVQGCDPVIHKEEMYITFHTKTEDDFNHISDAIKTEVSLIFPKDKSSKHTRIRRNGNKCTLTFIC